ncbi:MAG: YjjW family glycine radical enzyme activase [Flexilinea sp.]|nr:YjjW family glycine radical enzyme activase [Flexilinea sp.]
MTLTAPVNKIIPFSNVDGPSNRTAIFFQGCPFNCLFCHNPETINMCVNCGVCVRNCPVQALSFDESKKVVWDKQKCVQCDTCIKVCPHTSSPKITWMSVPDVMKEIHRTLPYIAGITTSGGECTQQNEFLIELFTEVQKLGKTCLIDSNGSFDFEADPRVLKVCDGVMLDMKAYPEEWHRHLIGHDREIVLKNLHYLLEHGKLYEVRTIIFPGRDEENEAAVRYVSEVIRDRCFYKIIRYRPFGVREKYLPELGEFTTDEAYALKYVELAKSLGAEKAYII